MQAPLGSYIRIASGHWVLPQQDLAILVFVYCMKYHVPSNYVQIKQFLMFGTMY